MASYKKEKTNLGSEQFRPREGRSRRHRNRPSRARDWRDGDTASPGREEPAVRLKEGTRFEFERPCEDPGAQGYPSRRDVFSLGFWNNPWEKLEMFKMEQPHK